MDTTTTRKSIPCHTVLLLGLIGMGLLLPVSGHAHDPSLHTEKSEAPECAALEDMDIDEGNEDDPVVQALKKKCEAALHHEPESQNTGSDDGEEAQKSTQEEKH